MNITEKELLQCDKNIIEQKLLQIKTSKAYFTKKLKLKSPYTNIPKLKSRLAQLEEQKSQYIFIKNLLIIDCQINFDNLKYRHNYGEYAYSIFERAKEDLLIGVICKILNNNSYLNLFTEYIDQNKYSAKHSLNPYNHILAATINHYVQIGFEACLEYLLTHYNISEIPKPVALNFVQCAIKDGRKAIYELLMQYFKLEPEDIEISYSTSLLFQEKEIVSNLDSEYPELKSKGTYKLRRSISNEDELDTEHTKEELDAANILAGLSKQ